MIVSVFATDSLKGFQALKLLRICRELSAALHLVFGLQTLLFDAGCHDFSKKCYFSFVKRYAVFTKTQYVL